MRRTTAHETLFRLVFDEHYESISRYCHRRLSAADANDVTAEVFTVAWRKIDHMPVGDEALPWLYGVARNEVRTSQRSVRRFLRLKTKLGGQAQYPESGPETIIVRNIEQGELLTALAKLTVEDQEVLRLRAYERLTHPQIAVVLGCSVEAAKKRSVRAMKRLRKAASLPDPQDAAMGSRVIQEGGDG